MLWLDGNSSWVGLSEPRNEGTQDLFEQWMHLANSECGEYKS